MLYEKKRASLRHFESRWYEISAFQQKKFQSIIQHLQVYIVFLKYSLFRWRGAVSFLFKNVHWNVIIPETCLYARQKE